MSRPALPSLRRTLLVGALGVAVLAFMLAVAAALVAAWYWSELPPLDKATAYEPRQHLQVYTSDGVEIAQFGAERRVFVPLAQIPPLLRNAVLAVEDARFYEHGGISWRGLTRAALANLAGGPPQGGSTITQQVARTFFLSMRRTPERKIKEVLLALQLESRLGKDRILELYMNQIHLGRRSYGFAAAAHTYFGKTLNALTLAETALLAGLPQNPIHANPLADLERAQRRQRIVLARMQAVGLIDEAARERAAAEPMQLSEARNRDVPAEHVAELVRRAVVERLGERAYTGGIRVVTSLSAADQRAADAAVRRTLLAHVRRQPWRGPEGHERLGADPEAAERAAALALGELRDDDDLRAAIVLDSDANGTRVLLADGTTATIAAGAPALRRGALVRVLAEAPTAVGREHSWRIVSWPDVEAAYVAVDPANGRLRAFVGGLAPDHTAREHPLGTPRPPGPALEPFLHAIALDQGPAPAARPEGDTSPARLPQLDAAALHRGLARFGLDAAHADGRGGVTPLQLARAFAMLANGGHAIVPVLIERITDARGEVLFEAAAAAPLDERTRVVSATSALAVNARVAEAMHGGASGAPNTIGADWPHLELHGLLATTADGRDAWFAGYAPGLAAVAWVGAGIVAAGGDAGSDTDRRDAPTTLVQPMWREAAAASLRRLPPVPPAAVPPR